MIDFLNAMKMKQDNHNASLSSFGQAMHNTDNWIQSKRKQNILEGGEGGLLGSLFGIGNPKLGDMTPTEHAEMKRRQLDKLAQMDIVNQQKGLNHDQNMINQYAGQAERDRNFDEGQRQFDVSTGLKEDAMKQQAELQQMKQMEEYGKRLKPEQNAAIGLIKKDNWGTPEKNQVFDVYGNMFSENPSGLMSFGRSVMKDGNLNSFDAKTQQAIMSTAQQLAKAGNKGAQSFIDGVLSRPGDTIGMLLGGVKGDEQAKQQLTMAILKNAPELMDEQLAKNYLNSYFNDFDRKAYGISNQGAQQNNGDLTADQVMKWLETNKGNAEDF